MNKRTKNERKIVCNILPHTQTKTKKENQFKIKEKIVVVGGGGKMQQIKQHHQPPRMKIISESFPSFKQQVKNYLLG